MILRLCNTLSATEFRAKSITTVEIEKTEKRVIHIPATIVNPIKLLENPKTNKYHIMKIIKIHIIILLILMSGVISAQSDSTTIYFKSVENEDLQTICELSDIQILKMVSYYTLLRNKVFNLVIREYKKGKLISEDDLKLTGETQTIKAVVNGDTVRFLMPMVDKVGFKTMSKSFTLTFAGILKNNVFKLNISYPGLGFTQKFKGTPDYQLRAINNCSGDNIRVPVNQVFPLLAYTPPFKTGSRLNSYCILGEEKVSEWYAKFKVEHFYAICLQIR